MIPLKLFFGDTIGIVSPSDPVINPHEDLQFLKGISFIEKLGFKTKIGENIDSSDPKSKAQDINSFFIDKTVKAIICSQGGDNAEKTLEHIDFQAIKNNPKIFTGISNITILLNAFNSKTGLITFHGNDIKYGFGRDYYEYNETEFIDRFVNGKNGLIKPNGERTIIREGKAQGKLFGGNLHCLLKLAGTNYWPDFSKAILFLESFRMPVENCHKYFEKLDSLKVFEKISGTIIGFNYGMQVENPKNKQMENILDEFTKEYSFPILKVNDFGHNCPNTVLPVGAIVGIDTNKKSFSIVSEFIR